RAELSFLRYHLRHAVRERRPELLGHAIILHDNAGPHTADVVTRCLQRWGWEVLPHPPYSPNLSPCAMILYLKSRSQCMGNALSTHMTLKYLFSVKWRILTKLMQPMVLSVFPIDGN
ncbi:hypothetical protein C0J52_28319, partial [Blattella germanica]